MAQPDIPAAGTAAAPRATAGFIRRNIREYGILFALVVIMIFDARRVAFLADHGCVNPREMRHHTATCGTTPLAAPCRGSDDL